MRIENKIETISPKYSLEKFNKQIITKILLKWKENNKNTINYLKISLPVIRLRVNRKIVSFPYVWNFIYLTIDSHKYWLYKYSSEQKKYFLYRHRDWEKQLRFEAWHDYIITVKDFINDANFHYKDYFEKYDLSVDNLKNLFKFFVKKDILAEENIENVKQYLSNLLEKIKINKSEFITYLDTKLNRLYLFFYDSSQKKLIFIWYDKISTGNPKRWKDYYPTPHLIIDRWKLGFYKYDRRAEWTDGMWYWPEGSRIFYLWKYYFNAKTWEVSLKYEYWFKEIHLAFHTTTPWGLTQLWKPMSKWCIRTSRFINQLYDFYDELNRWIFVIWNLEDKDIYVVNQSFDKKLVIRKIDLQNVNSKNFAKHEEIWQNLESD